MFHDPHPLPLAPNILDNRTIEAYTYESWDLCYVLVTSMHLTVYFPIVNIFTVLKMELCYLFINFSVTTYSETIRIRFI